jgi:hypothetical protein
MDDTLLATSVHPRSEFRQLPNRQDNRWKRFVLVHPVLNSSTWHLVACLARNVAGWVGLARKRRTVFHSRARVPKGDLEAEFYLAT